MSWNEAIKVVAEFVTFGLLPETYEFSNTTHEASNVSPQVCSEQSNKKASRYRHKQSIKKINEGVVPPVIANEVFAVIYLKMKI